MAGCSSADGVDDPYEPGQAVGVGIKAEMWKTKHPNLTILETIEDSPVLVRASSFLLARRVLVVWVYTVDCRLWVGAYSSFFATKLVLGFLLSRTVSGDKKAKPDVGRRSERCSYT